MKIPSCLKPGDRIRVISPAGKVLPEKVEPAIRWLEESGYEVITGKHLFNQFYQFSGTDEERLSDLQQAFDDPSARVIFCSRGGYGLIRLLDRIDMTGFLENPKWLVGFSDVTALHCLLNREGIGSVHGVMPNLFFEDEPGFSDNLATVFQLLTGEVVTYSIESNPFNRHGKIKGELVGGNLSLIYSLQATPYELQTDGKILFLEDTGEYLYHIDRMMHNLKLSGKLTNLKGLVIGGFSDVKDSKELFGQDVNDIIVESVKDFIYPVCFGFPAGHEKDNLALAFGLPWELDIADNECCLKLSRDGNS